MKAGLGLAAPAAGPIAKTPEVQLATLEVA